MDGMIRHICMPKHLKKWIEHTDSPPELAELKLSLSSKWVPFDQGEEHKSYVAKRSQTKQKEQEKANKIARTEATNTLMRTFTHVGGAAQGLSPAPPMAPPADPNPPPTAADILRRLGVDP
jgi:hypothetical protein